MRYTHEKPEHYKVRYGDIYICDHPVYSNCTLFTIRNKGLAVIQQRFDPERKSTTWGKIDPWLIDEIYLARGFKSFFDAHAGTRKDGLYPTVTVRQIMWALKMKPIKKERWETVFDHKDI